MRNYTFTFLLFLSQSLYASNGLIQNEDVKSLTDITAASLTTTGNIGIGNSCISSPGTTQNLSIGLYVYDTTHPTFIPASTTIIGLPGSCSAGQIQMSASATTSSSGDTLTFGGQKSQLINDSKMYVTGASLNDQLSALLAGNKIVNINSSVAASLPADITITGSGTGLNVTNSAVVGGSLSAGYTGVSPTGASLYVFSNANQTNEANSTVYMGTPTLNNSMNMYMGINQASKYSYIGSVNYNVGYRPLILQPNGSSVIIGSGLTTSNALLEVKSPNNSNQPLVLDHVGAFSGNVNGALVMGDPSTIANGTGIFMNTNGEASLSTGPSGGFFTWYNSGAEKMRLSTSGQLGIGTSSFSSGSLLSIFSNANQTNETNSSVLIGPGAVNGTQDLYMGVNQANSYSFIGGTKYNSALSNLILNPNGGKVAIGNTAPTANFEVNGTVKFDSFSGVGTRFVTADPTGALSPAVFAYPPVTGPKTSNYVISTNDSTVTFDTTSGNLTATLPTAVGISGQTFTVINVGANGVFINTAASQTIDQRLSGDIFLGTLNDFITVQSDGANWLITAKKETAIPSNASFKFLTGAALFSSFSAGSNYPALSSNSFALTIGTWRLRAKFVIQGSSASVFNYNGVAASWFAANGANNASPPATTSAYIQYDAAPFSFDQSGAQLFQVPEFGGIINITSSISVFAVPFINVTTADTGRLLWILTAERIW